jgi:hypothetical protein
LLLDKQDKEIKTMTTELKNRLSKVMTLGNKLARTMGRAAALRQAWKQVFMDSLFEDPLGLTLTPAPRKPFDPLKAPAAWDTHGWAVYRAQLAKEAGIPA